MEARWGPTVPSPSHSVEQPTGAALGLEIPRTDFGAQPGPTAKECTYLARGSGDTATQTAPQIKVRKTSLVKQTEHSNRHRVAKNLPFSNKTKAFELQRRTNCYNSVTNLQGPSLIRHADQ